MKNIFEKQTSDAKTPPAGTGPEKEKTVLGDMRRLAHKYPNVTAIIAALQLMSAEGTSEATQVNKEKTVLSDSGPKELPKLHKNMGPYGLKVGSNFVSWGDAESSQALEHNIKFPESLSEAGKMFVEPVTFSIATVYDERTPIAKVIFGGKEKINDNDFIVNFDVPYQYARDFKTATPVDQAKMEEEMLRNAKKLFDLLLPSVMGVSFYKENFSAGQDNKSAISINKLDIKGFASPESQDGLNTDSLFNRELSTARAHNAADVLRAIFQKKGIGVNNISYEGKGEIELSEEEKNELLKTADIQIDKNGQVKDKKVMDLIEQYNRGTITQAQINQAMDSIVGEKRKVSIEVDLKERKGVIAVPIPLFIMLLLYLCGRRRDEDDEHELRNFRGRSL